MRIAVTGMRGQLATALAEAGRAADATISLIGRPQLDLLDTTTIAPAFQHIDADVVINAAAYTAVDAAEAERDQALAINATAAGVLAEVTAARGIPLIQISTDYVFDGNGSRPYLETDAPGPQTVYGQSKLEGERRVAAANPRHAILRTSWVYSPWGHNFVRTVLRLAATRPELTIIHDQHGCPTYAPDLAEACLHIARRLIQASDDDPVWGITHIAGSGTTTWFDFATEILARAANGERPIPKIRPIESQDYPTPARRPLNSRLDCTRADVVFGVRLPHWTSGVERCLGRLSTSDQEIRT